MVKAMSHLANPIYLYAGILRHNANLSYYEFGKVLLALFYLSLSVLPK